VAQGSTREQARDQCFRLVKEYVEYVHSTYGEETHEYLFRPAPPQLMSEFEKIFGQVVQRKKRIRNKALIYPQISAGELGLSAPQ
jgi:hypothetical protein